MAPPLRALPPETPSSRAPVLKLQRVYSLAEREGVFSYARISPDGRRLAYASATRERNDLKTLVRIVNLQSNTTVFERTGLDAYWSVDGNRLVYTSKDRNGTSVAIYRLADRTVVPHAAPRALGDYHSWGVRDGRDIVLTVQNNYFFLEHDRAVLPHARVPSCPGVGTGERPLLSKDGRRVTTFIAGSVAVRNLTDCQGIVFTGISGAKADFSWDNRFIAFHSPKPDDSGYQIDIVDLEKRTVRTISQFGSSTFPSWTRDGRLCFRVDTTDFRGFVLAAGVLSIPSRPLPDSLPPVRLDHVSWGDVFPEDVLPASPITIVVVWSPSGAHSVDALRSLRDFELSARRASQGVQVRTVLDLGANRSDAARLIRDADVDITPLTTQRPGLRTAGALNQMPTALLFAHGRLRDRRLGAQSVTDLRQWIAEARASR